jgi:AcrR family transcriptional regulator
VAAEPNTITEIFGDATSETAQRLLIAALEEFATKGFHAATTRAIGEAAGVSPAGVYVHYAAKTDLLFEITIGGHRACLAAVEQALEDASDDPVERVRMFIEAFALWHSQHQTLARVSQYELASLPKPQLRQVVKLRRKFDAHLRRELQEGAAAGAFDVANVNGTTTAALSLCIDLARWYSPHPRWSPKRISQFYADLVLRMVDGSPG